MCKRKLGIFLVIASCVCLLKGVNAACDYETQNRLKSEAANIKAVYEVETYKTGEIVELEIPDENGNYEYELEEERIVSNIYNITEDLYLIITNLTTNEETKYYYSDTNNGNIEWVNTDITNIYEYEIKIYSNHEGCKDDELRKITHITPKYNWHADQYYCQGVKEYYCDKFITTELNMTDDQIAMEADKKWVNEMQNNGSKTIEKKQSFFEKYKIYIIIVVSVLAIGGLTIILVKRKQRSDVL